MLYVCRCLVLLLATLVTGACGTKKSEDAQSKIVASVSPDGDATIAPGTQLTFVATVSPGASGAALDSVSSGKFYYTVDDTDPTADSDAIDFDMTDPSKLEDSLIIIGAESIELDASATLKYMAVASASHPYEEKKGQGKKKNKKKSITLKSEVAETDFTVSDNADASADTDSDDDSCPSTALATSYTTAAQGAVYDSSANYGFGQSFILTSAVKIKSVTMSFYKNAGWTSPTSLTMGIQATNSGVPSGTFLASASTDTSSIVSTGATDYTASFSTPLSLSAGTTYWLVVDCPICSTSVKFTALVNLTGSYGSGEFLTKTNSITWTGSGTGIDAYFKLNKCAD